MNFPVLFLRVMHGTTIISGDVNVSSNINKV